MPLTTQNDWRKSSRSFANGNCPEVAGFRAASAGNGRECAGTASGVRIRDSKNPGTELQVSSGQWRKLLAVVRGQGSA